MKKREHSVDNEREECSTRRWRRERLCFMKYRNNLSICESLQNMSERERSNQVSTTSTWQHNMWCDLENHLPFEVIFVSTHLINTLITKLNRTHTPSLNFLTSNILVTIYILRLTAVTYWHLCQYCDYCDTGQWHFVDIGNYCDLLQQQSETFYILWLITAMYTSVNLQILRLIEVTY